MDYEEDWAVKIRRLKFESHNREWLVATRDGPGDGEGPDGPDGYRYDPYHEGPGGGGYRDDEYGDYPDEYRESPADMGMYSPGTALDNPQEYYGEGGGGAPERRGLRRVPPRERVLLSLIHSLHRTKTNLTLTRVSSTRRARKTRFIRIPPFLLFSL